MTEPGAPIPVDDTIAALRIIRGIHEGEPGPWPLPVTSVRGFAVLALGLLKANAELQGITDDDLQDRYVQEWLDGIHTQAIMTAAEHGATVPEGGAAEPSPGPADIGTEAGTAEACGILLGVLGGAPSPALVSPDTLRGLCLTALTAARLLVTAYGASDDEGDDFARGWLGSVREGALRRASADRP